jgi:hypothetical protein
MPQLSGNEPILGLNKVQRHEDSRRYVPSMEDSIVSTCLSTMTKEESNQGEKRVGFASFTEGETTEADWKT